MEKKFNQIGSYHISKTLGQGSEAKVKLAVKNNEYFAAKIFYGYHSERKSQLKLQKEVGILKKLKEHPHIIQYVEDYPNAEINKVNGTQYKTDCIILEYCENGSLFDWIDGTGAFKEILARTIFQQLVWSIHHMHSHHIYHQDLKLENILLKQNFTLKITDFGMAKDNNDLERGLNTNQQIKPTVYHAPEIIEQKYYNPQNVDVFAMGVILFIIITGHLPFKEANIHSPQEKYYKLIYSKDYTYFWALHSKNKGNTVQFSDDFKNLIEQMFEYDPEKRISISEICKHPWMNQSILSGQEIIEEFQLRNSDYQNYLEEQRIERNYQRPNKIKIEKICQSNKSKFIKSSQITFNYIINIFFKHEQGQL